jgi:dolichol-phosphate mannosyltransferase
MNTLTPFRKVDLSIIAPAQNEEENIAGLAGEVYESLRSSGFAFELLLVDDGSEDGTLKRMKEQARRFPWIRVVRVARQRNGSPSGKTAALSAGIAQAEGQWIAFMDADRQNDPGDLPRMLEVLVESGSGLVQGNRSADRRDNWIRRVSSWVGWVFCRTILKSPIRDAGCGFSVMTREVARSLPLQYSGMHRFSAFYAGMLGYKVKEASVRHRPRVAGHSKYGIWNRALPGLIDLFAVVWMRRRYRKAQCEAMEAEENEAVALEKTSARK